MRKLIFVDDLYVHSLSNSEMLFIMDKAAIVKEFKDLCCEQNGGFEALFTEKTHDLVFKKVGDLETTSITYEQLTELFAIANVSVFSRGFYQYYWLVNKESAFSVYHNYDITKLKEFEEQRTTFGGNAITCIAQLKWGIHRIVIDSLLYYGNINDGFSKLCHKTLEELNAFFSSRWHDFDRMTQRGKPLELFNIEKKERYLLSENASKIFADFERITKRLCEEYDKSAKNGNTKIKFSELCRQVFGENTNTETKQFTSDLPDREINSVDELQLQIETIEKWFTDVREKAIQNTKLFLSRVHDLDVYVATSMRSKADFDNIIDICDDIFLDNRINRLNLRWFNPTLGVTKGHEDKGILECLMVKCCKVLVYTIAGRDSYGKAAEAAMALSLGKPVIFLCEDAKDAQFYRDVHPLSRLVHFSTGVVNGAMIAENTDTVVELIQKIFSNKLEYIVTQNETGYKLVESSSKSVVRLQTSDTELSVAFWNNYYVDKK